MPPTPTALPPGVPYVFVPENYSLWSSVPFWIQSWNMAGDARYIIQAIILVAILSIVAVVLTRFKKDSTQKDSEA